MSTDHRLLVTPDRNTLVRIYDDGTAEVATRCPISGRWNPGKPLVDESAHTTAGTRAAWLEGAL